MIREGDLQKMVFDMEAYSAPKAMAYVAKEDMKVFEAMDSELIDKIRDDVLAYQDACGLKTIKETLDKISMETGISVAYLKKAINNVAPSREFLYVYTIGMKKFKVIDRTKAIDLANEYFDLKGGTLNNRCKADYICYCALRDNDDINVFFEQCKEYIKLPFIRKERSMNKRIAAEWDKKKV